MPLKRLDWYGVLLPNVTDDFATVLKRGGAKTSYISESLGHSNLSVTEHYLAYFEKEERIRNAQLLTNFNL